MHEAKIPKSEFIRWFADVDLKDIPLVGGKAASLGEMTQNLKDVGIPVPDGFVLTSAAYWYFIRHNDLEDPIRNILHAKETKGVAPASALQQAGRLIRQLIMDGEWPQDLRKEILASYRELAARVVRVNEPGASSAPIPAQQRVAELSVAVRSSATAEDLPDASFAGQQESYLNVHGERLLLHTCKKCFASLFTDRAISYREHKGFDHFAVGLAACVQQMVRSDLASSGVMFTIDTESGFRDAIIINSAYGLGESIVQGSVNPDEFIVFKPTLKAGFSPILRRKCASKETKMVYDHGGSRLTKTIPVPLDQRIHLSLGDEQVLQLARWGCVIEEHYSKLNGRPTPMDIEWAQDGESGELYILQARPETVKSLEDQSQLVQFSLQGRGRKLITGQSVGERVAQGKVRVIRDVSGLKELQQGEILVTDRTDPDWEPMMKIAGAIVTNRGGRTCHAAIVSRELGLPAIVGTERATTELHNEQVVTVSCAEGEVGNVYEGLIPFKKEAIDLSTLKKRPKTRVMLNLADPEGAFRAAQLPNDGIGLARMEFIINHMVKIHPMALIQFDSLENQEVKQTIEHMTQGYQRRTEYFVDLLAQGVSTLAAAFYPNDVILRTSDFKTNEYANLIGGKQFEPHEENPMIGFRGASRYIHERYRDAFALECQAILRVRKEMGLKNLKVMIPFCRTLEEGRQVLAEMARHGLNRGEDGLEIYVMCEIPSNVILAEEFAELFDGFSIGSNDLTQLTLGIDRDSEILSATFDERNEAVKRSISDLLRRTRVTGTKVGICGQAPSDYPEFAQFLVESGIDSLSLNPDSLVKTTRLIQELEAR